MGVYSGKMLKFVPKLTYSEKWLERGKNFHY